MPTLPSFPARAGIELDAVVATGRAAWPMLGHHPLDSAMSRATAVPARPAMVTEYIAITADDPRYHADPAIAELRPK